MKKTVITTVAVVTLVFGLGTTAAFAKGNRSWGQNQQNCPQQNRNMPPQMGMQNGMGMNPMMGMMGMGMRQGGMKKEKADLFGTVSAVSTDKKILTVKDADGKETQVHVNPFTRLHAFPTAEERKAAFENRKSGEKKMPAENTLTISDVKVGDWVSVTKLGGETKTIEAGRICVVKE